MRRLFTNNSVAFLEVTRRRTKVHRRANFVHSIKHHFLYYFMRFFAYFTDILILFSNDCHIKAFVNPVFCGLPFLYIRF